MSKGNDWSGWNSGSHDVELKNGETIKEYFLEFKTTDYKTMKYLKRIAELLMDIQNDCKDELLGEKDERSN